MFKSLDLSLIVEFMLMFYKDKPIDWLLDHIMWVKVCNPEKDAVRLSHPGFIAHLVVVVLNEVVVVVRLFFRNTVTDKRQT